MDENLYVKEQAQYLFNREQLGEPSYFSDNASLSPKGKNLEAMGRSYLPAMIITEKEAGRFFRQVGRRVDYAELLL